MNPDAEVIINIFFKGTDGKIIGQAELESKIISIDANEGVTVGYGNKKAFMLPIDIITQRYEINSLFPLPRHGQIIAAISPNYWRVDTGIDILIKTEDDSYVLKYTGFTNAGKHLGVVLTGSENAPDDFKRLFKDLSGADFDKLLSDENNQKKLSENFNSIVSALNKEKLYLELQNYPIELENEDYYKHK